MSMAARPPRKWTIVGDGTQTFGVAVVTDARYSKSATWIGRAWRSGPVTDSLGGVMCTVSAASELAAMLPVTATPSSCWRKSRWNQARRNSPSVIERIPVSSSLRTAPAIAASSTARSSAALISPFARRLRAACTSGGRRRLPTWSARNGGSMLAMGNHHVSGVLDPSSSRTTCRQGGSMIWGRSKATAALVALALVVAACGDDDDDDAGGADTTTGATTPPTPGATEAPATRRPRTRPPRRPRPTPVGRRQRAPARRRPASRSSSAR